MGCQPTQNKQLAFPEHHNYVTDGSDVLSDETEQTLEEVLGELDCLNADCVSIVQMAIVTLPTAPGGIEFYSVRLFNHWGIGHEDTDNGILFIIVTEDRDVRIEVGAGMEGTLTDSEAGQILDTAVVPFLKEDKWDLGTVSGVDAIVEEII